MWIDSHCHLNHPRLAEIGTPGHIIDNARAKGVSGMLTICCRIADEFPEILKIAQSHDNVWCTVGTHPHDAGKPAEKAVTLEQLVEIAQSDPKILGIGESGLDYYYKNAAPEDQQQSFRKHIRACLETDLPLVVHARDADEDIIRIIKEENPGGNLRGVMHCFSSGRKMAEEALKIGFYISFSGIVTFKSAKALQDIAKMVPLDRILIETDAPYLAPEPLRGRVNEPANVVHTGRFLAKLKDINEENFSTHCKNNYFRLLNVDERGQLLFLQK